MNFNEWEKDLERRWQILKTGLDKRWNSFFPSDKQTVEINNYEDVTKVFTGNVYTGWANLVCPVCGGDHMHVVSANARTGVDPYESGNGYRGVEARGKTDSRRDALCIGVEGECGHNFNIVFQQSKGVEMILVEVLETDLAEVENKVLAGAQNK
jgi:hypothetical protein